jgi:zinc protease
MDQVLAEFLEEGVNPAQLERIRTQLRAAEIYALDSVTGLANRYGSGLATGLTIEDMKAWPEVLQAVTAEDIMEVAREVLDERSSVTLYVSAPEAQAAATEPAPEPTPAAAPAMTPEPVPAEEASE